MAPVGDDTTPDADLDRICDRYEQACDFCLDKGFLRRFRKRFGRDPAQRRTTGLLSPDSRLVVKTYNEHMDGHTYDLECEHGYGKKGTSDQNRWELIASRLGISIRNARAPQTI